MSKKKESISITQFKAWLSGFEEMQPKSWSPSKDQWVKIRAKIDQLSEEGYFHQQPMQYSEQPRSVYSTHQSHQPQPVIQPQPLSHMPPISSTVLDSANQVVNTDGNYDSPYI